MLFISDHVCVCVNGCWHQEDERGFGIEISEVQGIDGDKSTLVISKITVGSPADRCGQLQTGDQLISVDGQKVLGYSYDKVCCEWLRLL